MNTYQEFTSSLKEVVEKIEENDLFSLNNFLTSVYVILLANYKDENEILLSRNTINNGDYEQIIMKINIAYEELVSQLTEKISRNLFIDHKHPLDNVNATIIISDEANSDSAIFSFPNQIKEPLGKQLIFVVNTQTYEQKIIYNSEEYSEQNIITLDEHIKKIITTLIQKPNIPLKELVILTPAEWNKIILEWNMTDAFYPEDKSIPDLFAEIVNKYPDSIALNFKDERITYKELDNLASNLAYYLIKHTPQVKSKIVAIYMERSLESFISLLGILKAGLAYLPIYLHFPPERIQMILKDAEVSTVITQRRLLLTFNDIKGTNIKIIPIESILEENHMSSECLSKVQSHDLAYIIYTSGTTGKPKGTKISHKGVCNLITHARNDFGITHKTRVLQFASLSFDASVYEWAGGLLNGAELYILAEDELPPKADLSLFIREKKINFALLPPPLLESIDNFNLKELHTLVSGGEACTQNIVDKWANDRQLFNAYGPSEATVACSFSRCYPQKRITIGKPIQNVKLYILNKQMQPVPVGVPGELYIGGVGLAQGYLNREDLTEKTFITNPFSLNKADRIYKTGDRVRWLENGEIEYIDRIDSQIKLEGYRIELGEIESVLNEFPDIESSSVIIHKIDDVHKQLIAFYILKKDREELNKELLKKFLNKKLPKYMIPASYIKLSSFPLTLTNKVDRKALIKIYEDSKNQIEITYNRKETIPILEQIWRELLNCENVTGNFFSLGGDSIRAIQFVAILRKYGYIITSKTLYDNPTIAELANFLNKETTPQAISNKKNSIAQGQISLSPIQHWFFEHQFKDYNQWNQAFLFQTQIPINKEYFFKAWELIIKYHDTFRLRYKLEGKTVKQYYSEDKDAYSFIFEEFDIPQSRNSDPDWITNKCLKLQNSLNIEKGPVLAIGIFNHHQDGQQRILIAIHHLLVDGVSWRILLEDFFSIYNQLLQFQEVKLLPKSDHYGAWIKALHTYATKESTNSQIAYWQNIAQKIKKDKNTKINLIKDQKHYALTFLKEITLSLLQDLPNYYPLQINDILLAGLAYALHEENKGYEYVIDLEGHGREECIEEVDVTRTIGWFTTIFPTLLKIPSSFQELDESSWGDLILEIKKELRQIPDKGIGYGILRYLSNDIAQKQSLNINSSILFNYLGQFDLTPKHQNTWSFALESPGNPIGTDYFGEKNHSRYSLEINALAVQESLCINFNYNKYTYSDDTIKRLANNYKIALEKFITIGKKLALGDLYLPSDSSRAKITFGDSKVFNNNIENEPYKQFSLVNLMNYRNVILDISLVEDIYPASYFQKRMLIEADQDHNATYHIVSNYSINAKFDKNKIVTIFKKLTKRHELLRSSFLCDKEGAYSVVVFKSAQIEFYFYENQSSKELIAREKINYFDYSKPGLFRLLVNDKGSNFDLIFSIHNALEDGWSMATLVNEFSQAYMNDKPIETSLKVRYGEYVRNEILAIQNQENIAFWKRYLSDVRPLEVNWKSDDDKSENSLFSSFFPLSSEYVSSIHKISKELKIGVDSIFLLAYLKTLSDLTQISDITLGISTHNRIEKEDGDKLFGSFINIIPFRFDLKNYPYDFDQLLEVSNNKMTLQKYKTLPYDYIKSLHNKELYNFAFDFVHMHNISERAEGVNSTDGYERTHIPFTLTVVQKGEEAFILSISAHDDFISRSLLNNFTQSFKENLFKTIRSIQQEMGTGNKLIAIN